MGRWNDEAPEKKFVRALPSKDHPFTNSMFCPKLNNREKLIYQPNRIKTALIRIGAKGTNSFKQTSLDHAVNLISEKLLTIRNINGPSSIVTANYSGNSGLISTLSPLRFFGKLGATLPTGGLCNEAGNHALSLIFGNYSTTNPFQIVNPENKLIVVWGSNLASRNNHAYSLVKKAIKNGSLVAVVNPVRTKIVKNATSFLQPFPGTDYLIAKFIMNKIIENGKDDKDFLVQHVDGYKSLIAKVGKIDEDKILKQTGLSWEELDDFVNLLIKFQHKTLFIVGYGPQKYFYGGKNLNTIALIQILLGNFGKPGTGFLFSQSGLYKEFTAPLLKYIAHPELYPLNNNFPLLNLGETLSSNKFKMLFIYNINPASSLPNQAILRKSLSRDDLFVVVLDMFLNETTNFADIVIPAKFDLESNDLITPYFTPGISINQGGPCPYSDCLTNYEFFQLLAKKIGWEEDELFQETQEEIFKKCVELLPKEAQQSLKLNGYYIPFGVNDIPFKDLNFPTFNGKIQISDSNLEIFDPELDFLLHRNENEFYLISPAHKYFIHSQLGEIHREFEDDFGKVYLNPYDIESNDLTQNGSVLVSNKYGEAKFIIEQNSALKSGTALIYSGLPFTNTQYTNVNFLTSEKSEESKLSGAYFSTVIKISQI